MDPKEFLMDKIRLACGHRAQTPYLIEKMMTRVYSPEELCYCIMLDAYLLDETFASGELAKWLADECGMTELCNELLECIRLKKPVDEYAGMILTYVGFCDEAVIEETCSIIRDNASSTLFEKNKARADYYLMCGHVRLALTAYNELLSEIPEKEKKLRSSIWHNCGYAYARMFRFNEAAKAFYCAHRILPSADTLKQFLTALRMSKTDEEYLEFISGHPEFYEASQKVEEGIKAADGRFETTDEYRMLTAMRVLREEKSRSDDNKPYYSQLDEITEQLKNAYREMVSD